MKLQSVSLHLACFVRGCPHRVFYQGSAHSRAIYVRAKKNLWLQAVTLCGALSTSLVIIGVKNLTVFGRGTPLILYNLQVDTCIRECVGWPIVRTDVDYVANDAVPSSETL